MRLHKPVFPPYSRLICHYPDLHAMVYVDSVWISKVNKIDYVLNTMYSIRRYIDLYGEPVQWRVIAGVEK